MSRRLLPVLVALLSLGWGLLHAQGGEIEAYMARGRELSKAGKPDQALPYFSLALELAEARFGADDPALIPMIDDLAGAQAARENYRDAEPLYERALRIQEREAAKHQTGIVRTLNKLGRIYEATQREPEALALYRQVITLWAPVLGGDHPDVQAAGGRLAKLALRVPAAPPAEGAPEPTARPRAPPAVPPPLPEMPARPRPNGEVFAIHLTSIRDPRDAPAEWDRLRRLHGGLLADLSLQVSKADLGPKRGVYYRVKGGTLARAAARARCAAFAARGVWCGVTGPAAAAAPPRLAARDDTVAPRTDVVSAPPGGYRVHLTSIRDPKDAAAEWARLRRLYGRLLAGLSLAVARADLGPERGVYYRVQGASLTRQKARALCAEFSARKVWCRVAPPGDEAAEGSQRLALQKGRRRPARHRGTRRAGLSPGARWRRRDRGSRRSPFSLPAGWLISAR